MSSTDLPRVGDADEARFHPARLVITVFAALLIITTAANWYAAHVSLPRYCGPDETVMQRLATIVAASEPIDHETRRRYMVAAKLAFLMPRKADEPEDAYVRRVQQQLRDQCR